MKRTLLLVSLSVLTGAAVSWWPQFRNEFFVVMGNRAEAGGWYGAWSGFGGALPDVLIITGMVAWYRRQNCEVHRCPRLARHQTAAGHRVCRLHAPGGAPTHQDVLDAHETARCGGRGAPPP